MKNSHKRLDRELELNSIGNAPLEEERDLHLRKRINSPL